MILPGKEYLDLIDSFVACILQLMLYSQLPGGNSISKIYKSRFLCWAFQESFLCLSKYQGRSHSLNLAAQRLLSRHSVSSKNLKDSSSLLRTFFCPTRCSCCQQRTVNSAHR